MSYGSKVARLVCQAGAAGGLVTALVMNQVGEQGENSTKTLLGNYFSVNAKTRDSHQVNDLYQGMGIKWNTNWDMRFSCL